MVYNTNRIIHWQQLEWKNGHQSQLCGWKFAPQSSARYEWRIFSVPHSAVILILQDIFTDQLSVGISGVHEELGDLGHRVEASHFLNVHFASRHLPVCDINLSWTQNKGNFLVKELSQRERKLQVSTVSHLMSWSVLRKIDWLVSKVARKALKCSLYITLLCMMGINQVCSCT